MKQLEGHYTDNERQLHGIALSEVANFIEQTATTSEEVIPLVKLSDLNKTYCQKLEDLGRTRWKNSQHPSQTQDFGTI